MAIPIAGSKQSAWFRALDHARLTGVKPFWRVGDYYTVTSPRTGETYRIDRIERGRHLTYTCSCVGAVAGKVCWHRALVAALPYEIALRRSIRQGRAACSACGKRKDSIWRCDVCEDHAVPWNLSTVGEAE